MILMSSHLGITGNYFFHHGLCLCPEDRINRIILPFCFTEAVWISKSAILPNIQVTKYLPYREWSCVMPVLTSGLLGWNHTYSVIVSKINPQTCESSNFVRPQWQLTHCSVTLSTHTKGLLGLRSWETTCYIALSEIHGVL